MFKYLLLLLPLLLVDSLVVRRDVILRGETQIDRNYFVHGPVWLLDYDDIDIDRLFVFDMGRFFYVTKTPAIDKAIMFSVQYIRNLRGCYFDLSAGERRFKLAYIKLLTNFDTMVLDGFRLNGTMKVDRFYNFANGLIYIENTQLQVTKEFSNEGTICLGNFVTFKAADDDSSLTVEKDPHSATQKGWMKLTTANAVTVPGNIVSNFCFPEGDGGYLEITSRIPDSMMLANFYGRKKIFIPLFSKSAATTYSYTEPYLIITMEGITYRFNVGTGYGSFGAEFTYGGVEFFHLKVPSGANPCPCNCTKPTYTMLDANPTFSTSKLQIATDENRSSTIAQQGSGSKVTPLATNEYTTSEAETGSEPEPITTISQNHE